MRSQLREKDLLAEIDRLTKIVAELKTSKPYGLVWEDKPEQFEKDAANAVPVLKPKAGKFKDINLDPDTNHNVLIEGDNYHALSVLSYTHRGKIDVIYIDPPYNTGNKDFRYNDSFVEKDDAYRHSKWLSFMEKRFRLAAELLAPHGLVFVSIDDNEIGNLRILMDHVFGENNFVACMIRQAIKGGTGPSDEVRVTHDYVLAFAKDKAASELSSIELDSLPLDLVDNKGPFRKGRELNKWGAGSRREDTPSMWFPVPGPDGKDVYPIRNDGTEGRWRWGKRKLLAAAAVGNLLFEPRNDGTYIVYEKIRDTNPRRKVYSTLELTNASGTEALKQIFGGKSPFSYPKPVSLVRFLIDLAGTPDGTVLDYFAGSGTTSQAVLELNRQDGGTRRFILCTNNENNICEHVTFERIKRIMKGYTAPNGDKINGLGGNLTYLKTDFVTKDLVIGLSDEAKLKLTHRANLLLALKENTFTPLEATDHYEITSSPSKLTAVYFREDKSELETMLDKLLHIADTKPVTVYIFAWEKGAYKTGIPGYPFDFQDIPEPIVEVYQSIGY